MRNLVDAFDDIAFRLSNFGGGEFLDDLQLSDGLVSGSIASAAVIACSDMGWLLRYVCSDESVNLHLFQNFGHRFDTGGFLETMVDSKVERVVIYGHSPCEYARFRARAMVEHRSSDFSNDEKSGDLLEVYSLALESDDQSIWQNVGRYNVLFELMKMAEHPAIEAACSKGMLKLHGWFFNAESAQLEVFDSSKAKFVEQKFKLDESAIVRFLPGEGLVGER
ncbi:hypothetical protein GC174_06230 [bacterium]|nr:hypothetical protein [bacterium]